MSPNPFKKEDKETFKETVKDEKPEISKRVTLISELDSYIAEMLQTQPEESDIRVLDKESGTGVHRLSLSEHLEPLSYDCTRGLSCPYHKWEPFDQHYGENKSMKVWKQQSRGKYVFRWISKKKLAIDHARNNKGWIFVNETRFPDVPKHIFSVSGALEEGDNVLAYMPSERALQLRELPGKNSRDRVKSETTRHRDDPRFYEAKLGPESSEGSDDAPLGAYQEGRDFDHTGKLLGG